MEETKKDGTFGGWYGNEKRRFVGQEPGCNCNGAPPQTPGHLILRYLQYAKARL